MRIWVLTDGRAGNENPALGLAEAVAALLTERRGEAVEITPRRLAVRPAFALAPPRAWELAPARTGGWPFTALVDRGAELHPPWPDLAIGAGRRSAPFVAAIRRLSGGASAAVQLLNPLLPSDRFDLVVAPAHDRLSGPGVLSTIGSLHRLTPARLAARDPRLDALKRPLAAALIGGPSRSAQLRAAEADALVAAFARLSQAGWSVAATASRRTPSALVERIRAALDERGGWLWDGAGDNPLHAMLGSADALIVTADSVNMASEACAVGAPTYLAPLGPTARKLSRFHEALISGGHARWLGSPSDLEAMLEGWRSWSPNPLRDVEIASEAVIEAMFGRLRGA